MEIKDAYALILSIIAVMVSIVSAYITYSIGVRQQQQAAKKDLFDTMSRIYDLDLKKAEVAKRRAEFESRDFYKIWNNLAAHNANMVQLILYLAESIPSLISSHECLVIASLMLAQGERASAEQFGLNAIVRSKSRLEKAYSQRYYASLLFRFGKKEEGRKNFMQSLAIDLGKSDHSHLTRGDTYKMWAQSERLLDQEAPSVEGLFKSASEEYQNVKDIETKNYASEMLHHARQTPAQDQNSNLQIRNPMKPGSTRPSISRRSKAPRGE